VRLGAPFAVAGFILAVSFAIVAGEAGFSPLEAVLFSAIGFAGSAQFAAISIIGPGGPEPYDERTAALEALAAMGFGEPPLRPRPGSHV